MKWLVINEYDEKVTDEVTDISSDRFDDVKWLMLGDGEMADLIIGLRRKSPTNL